MLYEQPEIAAPNSMRTGLFELHFTTRNTSRRSMNCLN
jgi:hypothetical protein